MTFHPDNAVLVATFDGQTPAHRTAADFESLRADYEREMEMRSISRIMSQRSSVCG